MAVEINELIIRATVESKTETEKEKDVLTDNSYNKYEIVHLCVAEILRILERNKER